MPDLAVSRATTRYLPDATAESNRASALRLIHQLLALEGVSPVHLKEQLTPTVGRSGGRDRDNQPRVTYHQLVATGLQLTDARARALLLRTDCPVDDFVGSPWRRTVIGDSRVPAVAAQRVLDHHPTTLELLNWPAETMSTPLRCTPRSTIGSMRTSALGSTT